MIGGPVIFATGPCICCRQIFSFNPFTVPSTSALNTGAREPICEPCITLINQKRRAQGLELWPVAEDAYGLADACEGEGAFTP